MIHSIERATSVETLLNTLEAERYVRGPLLATIVDELSADAGLEIAAAAARAILDGLRAGAFGESEFVARVSALRDLVQALSAPPESGEVLIDAALSRAVPRHPAPAVVSASASAA
ncbi:MAG: hypothetical protein JWO86_1584 [Myxococcaceae bacterium]|nr:hypothetical protein [Myxococcaceae bacterium]